MLNNSKSSLTVILIIKKQTSSWLGTLYREFVQKKNLNKLKANKHENYLTNANVHFIHQKILSLWCIFYI